MDPNPKEFQVSITKEIDIVKNRVRSLIGDHNWFEEGRYKEAILKNIIRKFLPNNYSVGSGYIMKENPSNQIIISPQLDIIIYNNNYPILFSEGDFIITTDRNVKGIVEVKTKVVNDFGQPNSLKDIFEKFNKLREFERFANLTKNKIFKGLFVFEYEDSIEGERIKDLLKISNGMINHISLGTSIFIRFWEKDEGNFLNPPVNCDSNFYNIYKIDNLSFSYFISNLLDSISKVKLDDRYWLLFPQIKGKEKDRVNTICVRD